MNSGSYIWGRGQTWWLNPDKSIWKALLLNTNIDIDLLECYLNLKYKQLDIEFWNKREGLLEWGEGLMCSMRASEITSTCCKTYFKTRYNIGHCVLWLGLVACRQWIVDCGLWIVEQTNGKQRQFLTLSPPTSFMYTLPSVKEVFVHAGIFDQTFFLVHAGIIIFDHNLLWCKLV